MPPSVNQDDNKEDIAIRLKSTSSDFIVREIDPAGKCTCTGSILDLPLVAVTTVTAATQFQEGDKKNDSVIANSTFTTTTTAINNEKKRTISSTTEQPTNSSSSLSISVSISTSG